MPGILNWALDGLTKVLAEKRIHRSKSALAYEKRFAETLNPVLAFVRDACVLDPESKPTPRSGFYEAYRNWHMGAISNYPLGRPSFYESLRMDFKAIKFKKIRGTDCLCGILITDDAIRIHSR